MLFKLNSILFCAMCIFSIFVDGIPIIEDSKTPPADQISEMLYKETTSDSTEIETTIENIFTVLNSYIRRDVSENDLLSFLEKLKNTDSENGDKVAPTETKVIRKMASDDNASGNLDGSINHNDDISVDIQPRNISDKQSLVSEHEYTSRSLYDEDDWFTEVPVQGLDVMKSEQADKKRKNTTRDYFDRLDDVAEIKPRQKKLDRKLNLLNDGQSNSNLNDLFGNKIFLFNRGHDADSKSTIRSNKNGSKGNRKFFLFDDGLPNPSSPKM